MKSSNEVNELIGKIYKLIDEMWEEMAETPELATRSTLQECESRLDEINEILNTNPFIKKLDEFDDIETNILKFTIIHNIHKMDFEGTLESYVNK